MRGGHSEMGKSEPGPYIGGKDDNCPEKDYTSPLFYAKKG